MENPQTWDEAERVIQQALIEHDEAYGGGVYAPSPTKRIADALRAAGLLLQRAPDPSDMSEAQLRDACAVAHVHGPDFSTCWARAELDRRTRAHQELFGRPL